MKSQCTTADFRRISRGEHEPVLEAMQRRLDHQPDAMTLRRRTVRRARLRHTQTLDGRWQILGIAKTMKAMKLAGAGAPSMRRTKATLIYRRSKNLRAVQLLLGHSKLDYVPRQTMSRRPISNARSVA